MPGQGKPTGDLKTGILWALIAYAFWGGMPLYVWLVRSVEPMEILCHRIAWSAVVMSIVVHMQGKWPLVIQAVKNRKTLAGLVASAVMVGINWGVYIYAAATSQVLQTSLGYYVLPLLSILFGMVVFHERLRPLQWVALAIATLSIALRIHLAGALPWISIGVALSFCFYGVLRKVIPVDASAGLYIETIILLPVALFALTWYWLEGTNDFGQTWQMDLSLALSGIVTVIPLYFFGLAARIVPLSIMGFMQYFSPSIQLLLGIFLFGESFSREKQISFLLIWVALGVFTFDSIVHIRKAKRDAA